MLPLLLAAAACASPCPEWRAGWNALTVDGEKRAVYALLPSEPNKPSPLLVALNGTTEDGQRFAARADLDDFAARGFLVLAPSSAGHGSLWPVWDAMRPPGQEDAPNADLALFDALVACAVETGAADPDRVYVAGHSAGGSMTNHVLQRRAEVLAGGIVGSGVFGNTSPGSPTRLDGLRVIVTWGGENDRWSGRAGGVRVRNFGFEPEASAASQHYAALGAEVVTCRGPELGHAWLNDINPWLVDLLLAHPRGAAASDALPPLPPLPRAPSCASGPFVDTVEHHLECGEGACGATCQLFADCAVENATVGPVLEGELRALGFQGDQCGGCVSRCEAIALSPADTGVLACLAEAQGDATCGAGVSGARPLIEAVNLCCAGLVGVPQGSAWCDATCAELRGNSAASLYFPVCRSGARQAPGHPPDYKPW